MRTRGLTGSGLRAAGAALGLAAAACTGAIDGPRADRAATGGADPAASDAPGRGAVAGGADRGPASGGGPAATVTGPIAAPPAACANAAPSVGASRWRRLTAAEYGRTVKDLLGLQAPTAGFLLDTTTGPVRDQRATPAAAG